MVFKALAFLLVAGSAAAKEDVFRINFGSCHSVKRLERGETDADIWNKISARNPDVFVWGGDIMYPDNEPATPAQLESTYTRTKQWPEVAKFYEQIGQENIIGIWDDHDYGWNNGGEDYEFKKESQQKHLDFFDVPLESFRRFQEGTYNSHLYFDDRIKVVLLDNRYFRDAYKEHDGDFLGEEQWNWFEAELNQNLPDSVEAVVVVSGLQMISNHWAKELIGESYSKFGYSRQKLFDVISASKAQNVILVSGDVHYTEMSAVKCQHRVGNTYLIPELTTSGMTHSMGEYDIFRATFIKYFFWMNNFEYQYEKMFSLQRNFGEMNFVFDSEDRSNSRILVTSFDYAGKVLYNESFGFDTLQTSSKGEPAECKLYGRINKYEQALRFFLSILPALLLFAGVIYLIVKLVQLILSWFDKNKKEEDKSESDETIVATL